MLKRGPDGSIAWTCGAGPAAGELSPERFFAVAQLEALQAIAEELYAIRLELGTMNENVVELREYLLAFFPPPPPPSSITRSESTICKPLSELAGKETP